MPHSYPHLLEPITVGRTTLRNRSLMGSMHVGLEEQPDGFERMAAFYAERAKGGAGLIVTGGIAPNDEGAPLPGGKTLTSETDVERRSLPDGVLGMLPGPSTMGALSPRTTALYQTLAPSPRLTSPTRRAPAATNADSGTRGARPETVRMEASSAIVIPRR